jgi:rhodanese-related sulfurtransferase
MSPEVPQVDPAEAVRLIGDGAFLLDVREDDEWAAGHAPPATQVRLSEVPQRVSEIPTGSVVVICRAGSRSQQAAEFLRGQGVDAVNLAGGMRAWASAGFEVVAPDGGPGTVI